MTDLKFYMKSRGTIDHFLLKFIYSTIELLVSGLHFFKIDIMRHIMDLSTGVTGTIAVAPKFWDTVVCKKVHKIGLYGVKWP